MTFLWLCSILLAVMFYNVRPDPEKNVSPIPATDFNPQIQDCKFKQEPLQKYLQDSPAPKKFELVSQDEINKAVADINEKLGPIDKATVFFEYGLESGGEAASWIIAIVVASGVTGTALAVASPAVGLFSLFAGVAVMIKDHKEKVAFMQHVHNNFRLLSGQMNEKFSQMRVYVDDSIVASDNERLVGELQQMKSYITDCFLIDHLNPKIRCLLDRCSYAKSGFRKFALFGNKLKVFDLPKDEQEKNEKRQNLNVIFKNLANIAGATNYNAEVKQAQEILKTMDAQDVRRILANIPTFNLYVKTVLVDCEILRYASKLVQKKKGKQNMDPLGFVYLEDREGNEWDLREKVLTYLKNSLFVIFESQKKGAKTVAHGYRKDYTGERILSTTGRKHPRKVQCRFMMNEFTDHCDKEYFPGVYDMDLAKARGICEAHCKEEEKKFLNTLSIDTFAKFMGLEQIDDLLRVLQTGPQTGGLKQYVMQAKIKSNPGDEKSNISKEGDFLIDVDDSQRNDTSFGVSARRRNRVHLHKKQNIL